MPFKIIQTDKSTCIDLTWDSCYESWIASSKPGPISEPKLPLISKRWLK
ncbi:hypothetical protein EV06_1460 [Prochlorococcus sp. MIT 0602]|nr:hypothetical protein EV06_1460 [Prochlorococcus sp. MIT 0602]KGG17866.1 hypothetical protein EV07_1309 [Prochlorococcus sp. MIT 0603]